MTRNDGQASFDESRRSVASEADSLKNEFRAEWIAGHDPMIEDFISRIPASALRQQLQELLAEELQLRRAAGHAPTIAEYASRFTEHSDVVELAFQPPTDRSNSFTDTHTFDNSSVGSVDDSSSGKGSKSKATPPRIGAFRLEKFLGEGGFGQVWRARDTRLDRDVAIKIPRPDKALSAARIQILLQEAKKAAQFDGDGVVTIHEVGEADGIPYIVTAFMSGGSLEDRLRNGDKWSPEEAADLVASLAAALHRAHLKSLVHRDIKPGNILCDNQRRPFLADFGLATSEEEQLQENPAVVGTWTYMSPEQVRGESHRVDARSDIYSLGGVAYFLLTGQPPFRGDVPLQIMIAHAREPVVPPRQIVADVPEDLEEIIVKCLAKEPHQRYADAAALEKALSECGCADCWSQELAAKWWVARPESAGVDTQADLPTSTLS